MRNCVGIEEILGVIVYVNNGLSNVVLLYLSFNYIKLYSYFSF